MYEEFEEMPKKKKYTIRMDITFEKEINQEEAERRLRNALHEMSVTARCGGIN